MQRLKLIVIIVTLLPLWGQAQFKNFNRGQKKAFLEAESLYDYGDYLSALELYKEIEPASEDFPEVHYYMGNSYYKLDRFKEALPYLIKGAEFKKDALYQVAAIYLYNEEIKKAKSTLRSYEEALPKVDKPSFGMHDIDFLKAKINTAEELMDNPEVVNIINLGPKINSNGSEYGPLISSDEVILIYTSRRLTEDNKLDPTGQPFENIYFSEKNSSNEWKQSALLPGEVNTAKHDAAVGLAPGGERLFIYRSNENLIGGDIYETYRKNGVWSKPKRMPEEINNEETIEPSASMSLDGKTFYFSSNRAGGYGGFDIYRVKQLPNGEWSLPLNLGPSINTQYDDDGPFIHPDGKTLYFSSQGHKNMGGFDVFKSELIGDSVWTQAENLRYPTNTTKDDIYFVISANEQHGYYSSDKAGGFGSHDIYMIDYLEKRLRSSVIRAKVVDTAGNPLNADISMVDPETGKLQCIYISDKNDGDFIFLVDPNVEYDFLVQHPDYEPQQVLFKYSIQDLLNNPEEQIILK